MANEAKAKDFDFKNMISQWGGYVSSVDKTNIVPNLMVQGSMNIYKKLSGTLAVREGQKLQGERNTTESAISSEFVWNTSWGATYTMVISDNKLWVVIDEVWYLLTEINTGVGIELITNGGFLGDAADWTYGDDWVYTDNSMEHTPTGGTDDLTQSISLLAGAEYVISVEIVEEPEPIPGTLQVILGGATSPSFSDSGVHTFNLTAGSDDNDFKISATSDFSGAVTNISVRPFTTFTSNRYVFDKWWSPDEQKDRLLFVNGDPNLYHWSGGYAIVASSTTNTITKTGTTTWRQAGFATDDNAEKKIMINGTEYTYTGGEDGLTLTGVNPDASGITVGATVLQSVLVAPFTPADSTIFANDFLKVINNQVYVGSYTSRLCYISSNVDFTNYVVPTPRAPGDPELLTLDGTLKGIGVRQGKAHIGFGTDSWAIISFNNITVGEVLTQQTVVDVKPVAVNQAPYAHEFIDTVGDSLIYLALDQQVRSFGDFNNLFTPGYPSLSQEIATELSAETFTGGALRCIGEFVYVTAPNTGRTYLYQVRYLVDKGGNVVAERLWHSPFIWNLTRVDSINGTIVGFSNANPQIYELWNTNQWHDDSPSGESLPYSCVVALGYRTLDRRQGLQSFDKLFTEGYITQGTPLNFSINYDYQGSTAAVNGVINSLSRPAKLFGGSNPASLGDSTLGDEPLGDDTESKNGEGELAKFKNINSLALTNCFEYQPIFYSDSADARWEILATSTNAKVEAEQDATFIINKIRQT